MVTPCRLSTEPDQHDLREDVAGPAALLQAEHHQERAGTEVALQVETPHSQEAHSGMWTSLPPSEAVEPFVQAAVGLRCTIDVNVC